MPVGDVLVGDARCNIKHDYTALSVYIVSIAETTKLLLTSGIPDIELNLAQILFTVRHVLISLSIGTVGKATYCSKAKRVDLDTKSCDILLLEFTGQMTLYECGLHFIWSAAYRTRLPLSNGGKDLEAVDYGLVITPKTY